MSDYKPTENNGLRQDGEPDGRVGTGQFAHGKVDPSEAGKKGGQTSGVTDDSSTGTSGGSASSGGDYKPTEHDGLKQDGTPDKRVKGNN